MTDQGPLWMVVARREVVVKLRDRAFLIGSVLTLALIVGLIGLQVWADGRAETHTVATTSTAGAEMAGLLTERAPAVDSSVEIETVELATEGEARTAVEEETVDAWLHEDGSDGWVLVTRDAVDAQLRGVVEDVVGTVALERNAEIAGTTVAELTEGSQVGFEQLEGDAQLSTLQDFLAFAIAFLFYLTSIMFGMTLAQSVVEEKQSRIVEIIAAAVPLRQLLAGKVLGNTLIAVAQMAVYVAVGLAGLTLTDYGGFLSDVSVDLAWFMAFFLVGFLALACLWAVAGALANRNEDLQSTATPVTMLLLAVFLASAFLEGRWEVIASYVPPLSMIVMPVRIVDGSAEWWEALVSLALVAGFAGLLVLLAERLYRRAIMQTGGRVSIRQAWTAEE